MMFRNGCMALMLVLTSFVPMSGSQAQGNTSVIRSFTVDQVAELVPGSELVFRVNASPGGSVQLDIDGVSNPLGLSETGAGVYAGAYTISIRDRIRPDSRVLATVRLNGRQSSATLAQSLLTEAAHAKAMALASPPPQLTRIETHHTGALTGGHELTFHARGTAGGSAQVSLDGGKTMMALTEDRAGRYSGRYTIKTRDQFGDDTQALFVLTVADKTTRATKALTNGAMVPVAVPEPMPVACLHCGVVVAVNTVKVKGKPNYIGAIAGGVAGAALGNQVGKGDGRTLATVLGVVGGAVAGREVEKQVRSDNRYDVVVRLDDGSSRTVSYPSDPGILVGAKVRFEGDQLHTRE